MFDEPNNPNDATRDEIPSGDLAAGPGCERPVADAEGKELAAEKAAAEVPAGVPVAGDLAPDTAAADPEHLDTAGSVEPTPAPAVTPVAKGAPKPTAGAPAKEEPAEPKSDKMDWYILKVQSNREESIREGLLRRVAIAGLEYYFADVIVPTEKVTEFKGGKKRVTKRKLYPGYLVVHMEINDDTWFLVRETPGIGDFTGAAGLPTPMLPHEVSRIVAKAEEKTDAAPKLKIAFSPGDRVKINDGTFENFEGEVETIDETNGRVTVMINIFGRSTPVELEYWQIEGI
ncbi:MAG: transcription termination/antitermination protein NusG [Thermoguttaceae bacterium]